MKCKETLCIIHLLGKTNYQDMIIHILTAMLMNETNFLRTAIISEKFFEGISLRMASTESWRERGSTVRLREGKMEWEER